MQEIIQYEGEKILIAYGNTDIGTTRKINQDYLYCSTTPVGNLPNIYIVADGMGGHKAGDVASKTAVTTIVETVKGLEIKDPISIMENALEQANIKVWQLSQDDSELSGMGTTVVMCTIIENIVYIANVGDSRLYMIGDEIRQITRDHSYVQELVRLGKIDKKEARTHQRKNELTRALGVEKTMMVDFFEMKINDGNRILMCSDGLTNMIEDETIKRLVKSEKDIKDAVDKLIDKANQNGGMDNITAILIEAK